MHTRSKLQNARSKKLRPNATQNTGWLHPTRSVAALFSVENAHTGDVLQTKIAQEVPLPDRRKVKLGSIVRGSVSGVELDEDEVGVRATFRLNQLIEDDKTTSLMTNLRAIASYLAVREAQTPLIGADNGTRAG